MINKLVVLCFLIINISISNAQNIVKDTIKSNVIKNDAINNITKNGTPKNSQYGFSLGYFGYKLYAKGVQLGVERYLATTNNFNVIGSLNMIYYNETGIQSAISLNARIGQRFTTNFGLFMETSLGLGVQQTYFTTQIFDYNNGVATVTTSKSSKLGVLPNIAIGIGYDFTKKFDSPVKLYLRPAFYWLYPDRNLLFQSAYALEAGIIYMPKF